MRMWVTDVDDPHPPMQNVYACEHGEWFNISEAWSDHELSNNTLTPNATQAVTGRGEVRYTEMTKEELQTTAQAALDELSRRDSTNQLDS